MKITNVSPINFKSGVLMDPVENTGKKFLYNEIQTLTREFAIPATFRTEDIKLPSVTKEVIEQLKKLNVNYKECS